jgi:hypothetical protein
MGAPTSSHGRRLPYRLLVAEHRVVDGVDDRVDHHHHAVGAYVEPENVDVEQDHRSLDHVDRDRRA